MPQSYYMALLYCLSAASLQPPRPISNESSSANTMFCATGVWHVWACYHGYSHSGKLVDESLLNPVRGRVCTRAIRRFRWYRQQHTSRCMVYKDKMVDFGDKVD